MADLVVVVPSRGRPEAVAPLVDAFHATCTAGTELIFSCDDNDPRLDDYLTDGVIRTRTSVAVSANRSMVEALNSVATDVLAGGRQPYAIGFMGDDHMPRTVGWDTDYLRALRELRTGIVYGNDLLQGANLPTQVAMTADIVRALGWMAPPALTHLYVDNFWRDLGLDADCLRYLPKTIIEHRHPVAGKAQWDEAYRRVNSATMFEADCDAYDAFVQEGGLREAAIAVRALRAQHG